MGELFIEMWFIIEIYFAKKWERALSSSAWWWGLGGEQGRGAEPAFPRKTARIPVQSGMEWGCSTWREEMEQGTRWVTLTVTIRQQQPLAHGVAPNSTIS